MNKCLFNVTVTTHTKYESPSAVYLIREDIKAGKKSKSRSQQAETRNKTRL